MAIMLEKVSDLNESCCGTVLCSTLVPRTLVLDSRGSADPGIKGGTVEEHGIEKQLV